jgi:tRNA (guanine26-N2/guanine27-N2)-dimethyltransferase
MTDADKYTVISEGKANILFPKENQVFYNPVQQFNRDLSVTCIRAWSEIWAEEKAKKNKKRKRDEKENEESGKPHIPEFNILEALSASGLRAIRYAKEIPGVKNIIANDFSKDAVASIERNVAHNKVEELVTPNESDANLVMYDKQFQVIDLDPYGSATPFIDAAVRSVDEDGLLLVTCTDLAVLAGNSHPEKCFSSYGGQTFHGGDATHESALRLVLHMIAGTAAKYGKCIEPQLSLSIDFYVRLFIRVKTSPIKVKELASNTMVTYHCTETGQWKNQYFGRKVQREKGPKFTYNTMDRSLPDFSDPELHYYINGPMWGGPLHNKEFIDKALEVHSTLDPDVYGTLKRIKGMLTVAKNEIYEPFYFSPARMSQLTKCPNFKQAELASAILNAGYDVSMSHASHECLKTSAPFDVIIDIYKFHLKKQGLELSKNLKPWGRKLMETPLKGEYDFTIHPKVQEMEKTKKSRTLVRYQENPTKNWGPKARAQGTHV